MSDALLEELVKHRPAIERKFRAAWVLYGLNTLVTIALYRLFPEDRALLRIYLYASIGPLIAQAYWIFLYRPFAWLRRFPIHLIALTLITLGMMVRGFFGTRQDLYVYLLLAMGPALYTSSQITALKTLDLTRGIPNSKDSPASPRLSDQKVRLS